MTDSDLERELRHYAPFGFPVAGKLWEQLAISSFLRLTDPQRKAADLVTVRHLADRLTARRLRDSGTAPWVQSGPLLSMGVIVDVLRYVAGLYCHVEHGGSLARSLQSVADRRGQQTSLQPPPAFVRLFPPQAVLKAEISAGDYLADARDRGPHLERALVEMILLFICTENPAFRPFGELFPDEDLRQQAPYVPLVLGLEEYFDAQAPFAPLGLTLFHCLRAPMRASPDSLEGQLDYIRTHWRHFLPAGLVEKLYLATDILAEERRLRGLGPGSTPVLTFGGGLFGDDLGYPEPAAFSRDADWMSNVVLIAKTAYVWLDQLSKKYGRHLRHLSDIPDEELDQLARWGFTGLWLIGVWERAPASQRLKQWMGNPEAVASAYSLYDYVIAGDLGGEDAYRDLRDRAWRRGIRLASDMVPNHMGLDSRWVLEHPDWFVQLDQPPYPWYQFTGGDLSGDSRVGLFIEDGYWAHSDAAVVFKRIDNATGQVIYPYHGNDGTSMPWNDTAQLNFLLPEVREAVIQTILHVARKFPVIRFDAAMTLAKRHYQRLWFPPPGEGGAIPTRAEHGLTRSQFDAAMPKEFWREVVDRIAQEAPDTLLLAEAFWLMEGYFVRTLGMHRVYNSAFMNMLKMEENSKYRSTVKNVLEFSPEVLKRFVNFMNNPDERTAVEQFGKGDKYFGAAVLMVTMPGLPMFGHGQIEGFTEKYGMEYRRAYWDEQVDQDMVHRHEREIFPLMRRRRLFSGAANFAFYDFQTPEGWVDENVFAYSNRAGQDRALIFFNNAYNETRGRIHTALPVNIGEGDAASLVRMTLTEALALGTSDQDLHAFRDHATGLQYLRTGQQLAEQGLYVELRAYQYHAFVDFRELEDPDGSWRRLAQDLGGRGVPDLLEAHRELVLAPLLDPFSRFFSSENLRALVALRPDERAAAQGAQSSLPGGIGPQPHVGLGAGPPEVEPQEMGLPPAEPQMTRPQERSGQLLRQRVGRQLRERLGQQLEEFLTALAQHTGSRPEHGSLARESLATLATVLELEDLLAGGDLPVPTAQELLARITIEKDPTLRAVAVAWSGLRTAGRFDRPQGGAQRRHTVELVQDWLLSKRILAVFREVYGHADAAQGDTQLLMLSLSWEDLYLRASPGALAAAVRQLLDDPEVRQYLHVNVFENVLWFNKERMERLARFLLLCGVVVLQQNGRLTPEAAGRALRTHQDILGAAEQCGYKLEQLVGRLAG